MIKKILYTSVLTIGALPVVTFAAARTLNDLVYKIVGYLNHALVLLMGVAVVIFVWNIIKYFIRSDEDHKEAAPYVMWSVIGFFVILSFWGLVNILQNTFGLQNSNNKPYSWSEFSNLFPSGGGNGGTSGGVFNGDTTTGSSNIPPTTPGSSNVPGTSK
ncbi:MAG: pilin [Candidatus Taylorbacteria bacterium]